MHFGIIGSGPIGRFYAAMLSKAGHQVSMLCRTKEDATFLHGATLEVTGLLSGKGVVNQSYFEPGPFIDAAPTIVLICTKVADNATLLHDLARCRRKRLCRC